MESIGFTLHFEFEIQELLAAHDELLKDKILDSVNEEDPIFEELESALCDEFGEEKGSGLYDTYCSYEPSTLFCEYVTVYEDEISIDEESSDFENGIICIKVPCDFDLESFVDDNSDDFEEDEED